MITAITFADTNPIMIFLVMVTLLPFPEFFLKKPFEFIILSTVSEQLHICSKVLTIPGNRFARKVQKFDKITFLKAN
jgi:hypothetical protein